MLWTHVLLSLGVEGNTPPAEFRLFRRGLNETSKGVFLFDDLAAEAVMTSYRKQGTRLMLDLEHLSLDVHARNHDPDARGWFDLEIRNGELWAVNVNWTPDGARRLTEKTQAYTSPAFLTDGEGRITKMLNAALVAMPATYQASALVAASRGMMTPEMLQKALEALKTGDAEAAMALLEEAIVAQAAGEPAPEAPAEDVAVEAMADAPNDEESEDEKKKEEDPSAVAASILASVGASTIDEIKSWKLAAEEAAKVKQGVELASRRVLVAELVKLGVEMPATAWSGDPKDRIPCERLSSEPLADLQKRVGVLRDAGKGREVTPPARKTESAVQLSANERAECAKRGIDPEQFLARKRALLEKQK